jgi:GTP-binding protein
LNKFSPRALRFVTSLASPQDLERVAKSTKKDHFFAFVGKSNVGKSSLINHLSQNKTLAKVSSTPGKTQLINLFQIPQCYVVDLPGYGFAKVSKEIKRTWHILIEEFFNFFFEKLHVFILIDPKKPISEEDFQMIALCESRKIPYVIIFTKIDQIGKTLIQSTIRPRLKELKEAFDQEPAFLLYSNKETHGRDALIKLIETALEKTDTTS